MEKIKAFLEVSTGYGCGDGSGSGDGYGYGSGCGCGCGYGCGDGYGSGYGCGYGCGDGYGSGYGCGDGSGSGYGYGSGCGCGCGYGCGDGIKTFNGQEVHTVDNVSTIITRVINNLAKGFILESDMTLTPCYVAKGNNLFAHGETAKEAREALQSKIFECMDVDEKIDAFIDEVSLDKKYPAKFFYDWHHKLTGSCEMGRNQFAREHDIDLNKDEFTVREFISLTENDYGGEVIKQIKERLNNK